MADELSELTKNFALGIVLNSVDMPRQFKPMSLDRDQSGGAGGGPEDEEAENKSPIKPIQF